MENQMEKQMENEMETDNFPQNKGTLVYSPA